MSRLNLETMPRAREDKADILYSDFEFEMAVFLREADEEKGIRAVWRFDSLYPPWYQEYSPWSTGYIGVYI